jgi:pimeloyl-ACP methyl ester carboxylesterase
VLGAVYVGPSLPMAVPLPDREHHDFEEDSDSDDGWAMYNKFAWRRHWLRFATFFMGEVFTEPHSTKQIEDTVGWAAETDGETMATAETAPWLKVREGDRLLEGREAVLALADRVSCPSLVIHGSGDAIVPIEVGRALAEALGAPLAVIDGGGHCPVARDPVRVNFLLREFIEQVARR